MRVTVRWGATILAALVVFGGLAPAAHAQYRLPPTAPLPPINPAFNVAPGLQIYSNMYNAAVLGQTIRQIPPYAFGFNPYPAPIINNGPAVNTMPYNPGYVPPVLSGYPGVNPGYTGSSTLSTNPYGYDNTLSTSPYSSYNNYNPYAASDPSYGFLSGTSDVINATGNYFKNVQAARLTQAQADEARIDYRRRLIDEARYERGLLPTTEELRQQDLARDLARARHEPPISDIISAKSLNDLLHHLTSDPSRAKGPDVRIPDGVLDHVNVTSPNLPGAGLGLLKDDGKLQWPQALAGKEFDATREGLSKRLEGVVGEDLKFSNPVQPGKLKDLNGDLDKLRNLVEKSELSPSDYIDAKGYLDQVGAAVRALGDANVAANFNHKFSAKNVAELVDDMRAKGLDFAPAAPADAGAYRALQQALVAYDYGASPQASTQPPSKP